MQHAPLRAGDIVGDYKVVRPLSEGGMGAVYVVEQLSTGKRRALKVMLPSLVADERSRARFIAEAKAGAQLTSEHVVEVIAAGVDESTGVPWIAMELLEGEDLGAHVRANGPCGHAEVVDLLDQLTHALAQAHAAGIVHRDLKPENLFLARGRGRGARPVLKILDFGIASFVAAGQTAATVTTAIGSPLWLAPEQASSGGKVRAATDVWSTALIAFHLLTGKHYWLAASSDEFSLSGLLAEVLVLPLPRASERAREVGFEGELPDGFDAWFERCTARDPSARPPNAEAAFATFPRPAAGDATIRIPPELAPTLPMGELEAEPTATAPAKKKKKKKRASPTAEKRPLEVSPTRPTRSAPTDGSSTRTRAIVLGVAGAVLGLAAVGSTIAFFAFDDDEEEATAALGLSPASVRVLDDLSSRVEITAYASHDLPRELAPTVTHMRSLLDAYAANDHTRARFVEVRDAQREQAHDAGLTPFITAPMDAAVEDEEVAARVGSYCGVSIRYRGEDTVLPLVTEPEGLEHAITSAIRRLARAPAPIGVVSGHGSPALEAGLSRAVSSLEHYELRAVDLATDIDPSLQALLVIDATEPFGAAELERIDRFVMRGRGLGVFGGALAVELAPSPVGRARTPGLAPLLAGWGISLGAGVIADARCGRVPLRLPIGVTVPAAYPPAPIVMFDEPGRHPLFHGMGQAALFFAAPIETDPTFVRLHGRVHARSSEQNGSWLITGETIALEPREESAWSTTLSERRGPFTVIASLEGLLPSALSPPARASAPARVLVIGTGTFARDDFMPAEAPRESLLTRAVEWLTADPEILAIHDR
jgi:serine/threonine protein kinase